MKKALRILLGVLSVTGTLQAAPQKMVMMTQIVQHPALDAVAQGVRQALKDAGYDEQNLEIVFESAQGSPTLAIQIAQKFAGVGPDVIVAISTPSAQAVASAVRGRLPVVFAALTDPVSAKLTKDPEHPTGNVTGVTDLAPFDRQLAFIKKLIPSLKTLGLLYNPGEANSAAAIKMVQKTAEGLDIKILPQAVNQTRDVGAGAQALVGKVEAVFIANDNTVASGLEAAVKVANTQKMPLFAADIMLVERGLPGMIGFDYFDQGLQAGKMVVRLLQGERASHIPVENPQNLRLYINEDAAKNMGVILPQEVLKSADKAFGKDAQAPKA
jgi:putative tryptophan/tyrosine transport system substrate-binding protein